MNLSSITPREIQENWSPDNVEAAIFCIQKWYSSEYIKIYCDVQNATNWKTLQQDKILRVKATIEKIADELNIDPSEEKFFDMVCTVLLQKNSLEAYGLMELITHAISSITETSHLQDLEKPIEEVLTYTFKAGERVIMENFKIQTLGDLLLACSERPNVPGNWNFRTLRWFGEVAQKKISETISKLYGLTLPLSEEQKEEIREYREKKSNQ